MDRTGPIVLSSLLLAGLGGRVSAHETTRLDGQTGFEPWTAGEPLPPDVLFEDGFESGDAPAWGVLVP